MNGGKIILQNNKMNYHAAFGITRENLPGLIKNISLLHPDEKTYYDTLKFDRRKASYLLGRFSAKKAVSELTNQKNVQSISIDFGIFRFPVVKNYLDGNIQVSISHCDDIGIAFAFPEEHPLGIDIEKVDPDKIEAIKTQIHPNELELISNCNLSESHGYATIWTIKESLSKIFRTGLTIDFKIMEIKSLEKIDGVYVSTFCHFGQYKAITYHSGNYIFSVALPKNTIPVLDDFWYSLANSIQK